MAKLRNRGLSNTVLAAEYRTTLTHERLLAEEIARTRRQLDLQRQNTPAGARTEAVAETGIALMPGQPTSPAPTARFGVRESPPVLFGLLPARLSRESLSPDQVIETLRQWTEWARGAHAPNTEVAWASDWRGWLEFCAGRDEAPLPANPLTVRAYIERRSALGRRKSTIRRNVATIAAAHAAANLPNPCEHPAVHLALKVMGRTLPGGARQARGLVWAEIAQFLAITDQDARTVRERALLSVGYDAMTRREELVAVDCEDLTWCADGSARLLIRRSKTDPEAEGSLLYLAAQTALRADVAAALRDHDRSGLPPPCRARAPRRALRRGQCHGYPEARRGSHRAARGSRAGHQRAFPARRGHAGPVGPQ